MAEGEVVHKLTSSSLFMIKVLTLKVSKFI